MEGRSKRWEERQVEERRRGSEVGWRLLKEGWRRKFLRLPKDSAACVLGKLAVLMQKGAALSVWPIRVLYTVIM